MLTLLAFGRERVPLPKGAFQGSYLSMQLEHSETYYTKAPSIRPQRIVSVDLLRGFVMMLMALDHTREYFSGLPFVPEDLNKTFGGLFFTRVITHLCAPVFFLLAGTGAYLSVARGKTVQEVSRFFWSRGVWLIFLELTVLRFAWDFTFNSAPVVQTIWALGWWMIAMALIVRLPAVWIGGLGVAIIGLHNLLDWLSPASLGKAAGLWTFLHVPGFLSITPQISVLVGYPLIPWVGVMAAGYALGALIEKPDRRKRIFLSGIGLIRLGLGWAKSHAFQTGQTPVLKYNRQLMQAILHDKIRIAKAVNVTVISLDEAPKGYVDFDKGAAKKFVLDPHKILAAA
jgi:uncharacterized membrane protein